MRLLEKMYPWSLASNGLCSTMAIRSVSILTFINTTNLTLSNNEICFRLFETLSCHDALTDALETSFSCSLEMWSVAVSFLLNCIHKIDFGWQLSTNSSLTNTQMSPIRINGCSCMLQWSNWVHGARLPLAGTGQTFQGGQASAARRHGDKPCMIRQCSWLTLQRSYSGKGVHLMTAG